MCAEKGKAGSKIDRQIGEEIKKLRSGIIEKSV
jgi:hypothetical protein